MMRRTTSHSGFGNFLSGRGRPSVRTVRFLPILRGVGSLDASEALHLPTFLSSCGGRNVTNRLRRNAHNPWLPFPRTHHHDLLRTRHIYAGDHITGKTDRRKYQPREPPRETFIPLSTCTCSTSCLYRLRHPTPIVFAMPSPQRITPNTVPPDVLQDFVDSDVQFTPNHWGFETT